MKHTMKTLILSQLIVIVCIALIAYAIMCVLTMHSIEQTNIETVGTSSLQADVAQIEDAFDEARYWGEYLSLSTDVKKFLQSSTDDTQTQSTELIALISNINDSLINNDYIHSYCIVDSQENVYWSISPYDSYFVDVFTQALGIDYITTATGIIPKAYSVPDNLHVYEETKVISYVTNVISVENGKWTTLGQIVVQIDMTALGEDLLNASLFDAFYFSTSDELLFFSTAEDTSMYDVAFSSSNSAFIHTADGYYFTNSSATEDWVITACLPEDAISYSPSLSLILLFVLIIIIAVNAIVFFGSSRLRQITKQIVHLEHQMGAVANGDLDATISLDASKEMHLISNAFNHMVSNTKSHMQRAVEYQSEKQKVSFELLLAKINPHFIYNTLNSVIYLARQNKNQDIIKLTSAFIYLLQDSIHLEENTLFARASSEMDVIQQYIIIQKYRYANQFSFDCNFDSDLEHVQIPKNILQPLVENAIIHGVCGLEQSGHILLDMQKEDENIRIIVQDNGVGMSAKKTQSLLCHSTPRTEPQKTSKVRAIGIQNIFDKLHFVYQDDCTFSIESSPQGTTINILLPLHPPTQTIYEIGE